MRAEDKYERLLVGTEIYRNRACHTAEVTETLTLEYKMRFYWSNLDLKVCE